MPTPAQWNPSTQSAQGRYKSNITGGFVYIQQLSVAVISQWALCFVGVGLAACYRYFI